MKNHPLFRLLQFLALVGLVSLSMGAHVSAQDIVLEQPATTAIADGGAKSFGTVVLGSPVTLTFTVRNTGAAPLTLGVPTIDGLNAPEFSATTPVGPVSPGNVVTFNVTCTPASTGPKVAALHLPNNVAGAKNPYDINLSAAVTAPEISVEHGTGFNIVDGGPSVSIGTVDLGANPTGTVSKIFTINNTGNADLILSGAPMVAVTGSDASQFSVTAQPTSPVTGPTGSTTFTVRFAPTSRGTKSAVLQIANNDVSENPFDINITGSATAPEIGVAQGATAIASNGTQNFGTVVAGSSNALTFTIRNTGDSDLTGLVVTLDGPNATDFKILTQPLAPVNGPAGSTTLTVEFSPPAAGPRTAALHITNNDPDGGESPYNITLTGNGQAPAAGTDVFGYRFTTTPQNTIILKETDADVNSAANLLGDDTAQAISLGFNFVFYDKVYSSCSASTNGLITFEQSIGSARSYVTHAFPNGITPNNCIAPFWTDLVKGAGSKILYTTRGGVGNRVFIMDYQDMEQYGNSAGEKISFQVLLYEGSNAIEFQYKSKTTDFDMSRGITSGIENSLGTDGINLPIQQFPYAITLTRPVFYTVESTYLRPNSPPPVSLTNAMTVDGSPNVTHFTAALSVGMRISGTNIPPGATITSITSPTSFVMSVPATGNGAALTLSASTAIDVGNALLNPRIGTGKSAHGTVQRFEAPEYIYLNRNFQELPGVGDVNAPDSLKAWYRLVNDGYALDGQVVQGVRLFFTTTLTHDVTVVWRWRLEFAVIIDSSTGQGGFGNPVPEIGRVWRPLADQFSAAIDSKIEAPGTGLRFRTVGYTLYNKEGTVISPGIDVATGLAYPAADFMFPVDVAPRRSTVPISISEPLRLRWNFVGQVRYRFDATSATQAATSFDGQSFVRVYKPDRVTVESVQYGSGLNTDVWIDSGDAGATPEGRKVDVGAFYRSKDQYLTLGNFGAPPGGDLTGVQMVSALEDDTTVLDQQGAVRVSRIFTVRNANAPTEIHWVYQPTIFRAEVPLGKSLDVAPDGLVLNDQLSPALPPSAVLKVADTGPGTTIVAKVFPPDGSLMTGAALRWDSLGKDLFPVHPGAYEVAWPDANDAARTYKVEILTGYPGDTVTRASASEGADGARLRSGEVTLTGCATTNLTTAVSCSSTAGLTAGMSIRGPNIPTGAKIAAVINGTNFTLTDRATGTSSGLTLSAWKNYLNTVVLPEIDPKAGFPAQKERAHYHHLFEPVVGRQVPTKLDLSASDEWKFQELTFADASTGAAANKTAAGIPFTATGAGRSVLLYSYRPNPDEVADGTPTQENLAVRVVRSNPVSVISRHDPKLVLGQRGLNLGSGAAASGGAFGLIGTAGTFDPGTQFVLDFWMNSKGLQSSSSVTLTNCKTNFPTFTCTSTAGLELGMHVSGPGIQPGSKITGIGGNGTTFTISKPVATPGTGLTLTASFSSVALNNCATNGTTNVTCASTADVVAGMSVSGDTIVPGSKIESVTSATTFVLTIPATGNATGLSLTAFDKPVTVLTSGSGGLKLTLDPASSVVTASYRGLVVNHQPLPRAGATWRHFVIHVFTQEVFATATTVLDFYIDGVRQEQALPTSALQGNASSTIAAGALGANSFLLGVDADPVSNLQVDQFRFFTFPGFPTDRTGYLTPGELRLLKTERDVTIAPATVSSFTPTTFTLSKAATATSSGLTIDVGGVPVPNCATTLNSNVVTCPSTAGVIVGAIVTGQNIVTGTQLRATLPRLWYSFEVSPAAGGFANYGTQTGVTMGPLSTAPQIAAAWGNTDLQEVATRIDSTLDNAGFGGSGFIRNEVTNFNSELYNRTAEIGAWGPIFPVNHSQLFAEATKRLEVAYYENPYLIDRVPHPNVAWPYVVTEYQEVTFPAAGPNRNKAIYIASRIGSEGVDQTGKPQIVFDLAQYSNLKIYHQPDATRAGYNPNEEHALTAPSGRAAVKVKNVGESLDNNPPLAAFALQVDVNNRSGFTSEPWVLVQVNNLRIGEPEMAAYKVFKTRSGSVAFPRPPDAATGGSTGLAYEAAATPEARFLTLNPAAKIDFTYNFDYPVFAGDLLVPPYPLNLVIGNVSLPDERGGNIVFNAGGFGINQRTLWRDANLHAWIVSGGGGRFFEQYFYPMRSDFFLPEAAVGQPVAWLSDTLTDFRGDGKAGDPDLDDAPRPVKVTYTSQWRTDYPKLKRGETLTFQGGEYFNENPGSQGLPALVAMRAAEIVYDSATPTMVIGAATTTELDKASARIIRPLDRREYPFTNSQMIAAGLVPGDPASSKVIVVAERWYFKDLSGSLQKRFYYNSLEQRLVFRGRLNDKESGDANLTSGPDPINSLEPNIMTVADYKRTAPDKGIRDLSADPGWTAAIDAIFALSQNPNDVKNIATSVTDPVFLQGVKPIPADTAITPRQKALLAEQKTFYKANLVDKDNSINDPKLNQLDSFGVGSALVPNANLLTMQPNGSLYITIAENSREELGGAPVSLHIIEIIPDRFRGAIKVIEGSDAFSERITLQHNGEFGANTGNLDYEWWIRDATALDDTLKSEITSLTSATPSPSWQLYKAGAGLHTIVFEGRPDVILADKLVLMRYRHKTEVPRGWVEVPFEVTNPAQTPSVLWKPGTVTPLSPAPFQWAGAANSPQFQADGSRRYIPQLVMGWIKRILDRINPYEARYTDFFGNEGAATYSSQIQIAGAPYAGDVALNPDKNVIERTGLIELYRTVLNRAEKLSIGNSSNGTATDGINQALLLAATRLSVLYELLAREAYSDAQDTTISVDEDGALGSVASFTHAFQNLEPDLLHEELSLLRGTDFRKSYPVYNRMFWNYAKGLGEAAYNANYNIYDVTKDGFIDEDDARKLYPQGHGDAWGHYLSAVEMHYLLLQEPNFSWKARAELYSLMQNVLPVDFLDEKTFARLAAGKARTGRDIVRATYRLQYTNDPDGQWQGYTDGADKARAWGVSEWAHRAGQGAYFDWAIANAILPAQALGPNGQPLQNLAQIERRGAESEIGEVAGALYEIQTVMDESNNGSNPLGFSSDAIAFDIDPTLLYVGSTAQVGTRAVQGLTHFEQIFERALIAGRNATAVLATVTQADNKLRILANDTEELIIETLRQDLDYRNRLIEIFGRPYSGQIGFGKAYPEGYEGPDTLLYGYLDKTKIDQIVPGNSSTDANVVTFTKVYDLVKGLTDDDKLKAIYSRAFGGGDAEIKKTFETIVGDSTYHYEAGTLTLPYDTASKFALQAPTDGSWGRRTSYGKVQTTLGEMLAAEIALDQAIADYIGYLQDWEQKLHNLQSALDLIAKKKGIDDKIVATRASINATIVAVNTALGIAQIVFDALGTTYGSIEKALPIVTGIFDYDVTSIARGIAYAAQDSTKGVFQGLKTARDIGREIAELLRDELVASFEREKGFADDVATVRGLVAELEYHSGGDQPKRDGIGLAVQELELKRQEYTTSLAEGFRLLREREAFNKVLAAKSQKNRYKDMIVRLTRNEAMAKYQSSFNLAARYTWLAAKAYDYETSLDPGDPASATTIFDQIVKERQLGLWDGDPKIGQGGLAELLATLRQNYESLEGQLGLNHIQVAYEGMSMRVENYRIGRPLDPAIQEILDLPPAERKPPQSRLLALPETQQAILEAPASNDRWKDTLKSTVVDDLWQVPEFRLHCRSFADPSAGKQPGLVIRFSGTITPGLNYFGRPLVGGDHAYSSSQFSTRIAVAGVLLRGYPNTDLATTPRAYLIPVGTDFCNVSTATYPVVRSWSVKDARIPTPFVMNASQITSPSFIPQLDGADGSYGDVRRHADFRMFHEGDLAIDGNHAMDDDNNSTRLMARSVWNSHWLLIIPGAGLYYDAAEGVRRFTESVTDIELNFKTYSHNGQ